MAPFGPPLTGASIKFIPSCIRALEIFLVISGSPVVMSIIYVPFLAVFTNPSSPFTTFSTIVLVGKHKKTREVCEANLAGVEQAKAPLSVKYLILFSSRS